MLRSPCDSRCRVMTGTVTELHVRPGEPVTSTTLLRQWTMLRMIPRHPRKITVSDLAARLEQQGFPVTERTVQRDLQTLSGELFALTVDDRSRPYGWQWARDAEAMDIPGMEPQTALAFKLAGRFLSPLLAPSTLDSLEPHFRQAERVLRSVGGSPRAWPDKVRTVTRGQSLIPPRVDPEVLMVAYDALFEGRRFAGRYRRRYDGEMREYVVNPLGLVFRDGVIYLIASLFDYDDVVQLALHRMLRAESLEETARRPEGFDLDGYLRSGGLDYRVGESLRLRLQVSLEVAFHLEETPLAEDQRLSRREDGAAEVRATVRDTLQLRWWLLGLGSNVEVLGPEALRAEVALALRKAAEQ